MLSFIVEQAARMRKRLAADGVPERMVMGWMKLSYKMPSTM
jgi:hypothetical protein